MVCVSWGPYLYDGPYLDLLVVKLHAFTAFCTALLQFSTGVPSRLLRRFPTGHIYIADLETPFRIPAGCHPEQIGTSTYTHTHIHL